MVTEILASESAPTKKPPVSVRTDKLPVVDVLVSVRMNALPLTPFNASAFVAVPLNRLLLTVLLSCIPGAIVANPTMATCGVNVASLEMVATTVPPTYILITV